jgi:hypothetical protein
MPDDNTNEPKIISPGQARCLLRTMGVDTTTIPSNVMEGGTYKDAKMAESDGEFGNGNYTSHGLIDPLQKPPHGVVSARIDRDGSPAGELLAIVIGNSRLVGISTPYNKASETYKVKDASLTTVDLATGATESTRGGDAKHQQASKNLAQKALLCFTPGV